MTTDLVGRLPELEREAEELERKAKALRQIIDGVRALNGDADALLEMRPGAYHGNQHSRRHGPRGREAVRMIVADLPGSWRVLQVKDEIKRRGWTTSPSGVEKALMRMTADGEIIRLRKGVYRTAPADEGATVPVVAQGALEP